MIRKEMQEIENKVVEIEYDKLCNELNEKDSEGYYKYPWFRSGKNFGKQLRSCSAYVLETENYYVLKSYNTIIACIDKENDSLYDFLRMVYGFTSTSAQHISKFNHEYCAGYYGCKHTAIWRDV